VRSKDSLSLLVRADASAAIGTGHVMRCLAVAKAWQKAGGRVCFLMAEPIQASNDWLAGEDIECELLAAQPGTPADADKTAECARRVGAAWVVVDGYRFGPDYVRQLKAPGARVLALDDDARLDSYEADIVLNQSAHATPADYPNRAASTRLLLGSEYVLLRPEFLAERHDKQLGPLARKLLVTMGGSDCENVTSKVVRALSRLGEELEVTIVAGGANPHHEQLRAGAENLRMRLERSPENMARLMNWADFAISAAGGTCWELAFMGVPMILVVLSRDQTANAAALEARGAAINLGWHNSLSEPRIADAIKILATSADQRRAMSERGQKLVDGKGAERVVDLLLSSV
jgi:UDP-2,4-diacetamido-2,4,6-trideoxy-beta-L-altropyranose hydrolase